MCGHQCTSALVGNPRAGRRGAGARSRHAVHLRSRHEVGRLPNLRPGGVLIDVPHVERERRCGDRRRASQGAKVLYEPAFEHDGCWSWRHPEAGREAGPHRGQSPRSSSRALPDLAIQAHVLRAPASSPEDRADALEPECAIPISRTLHTGGLHGRGEECFRTSRRGPHLQRVLRVRCGGGAGRPLHHPWECPFMDRCCRRRAPRHRDPLPAVEGRRDEYRERGFGTILDLPGTKS